MAPRQSAHYAYIRPTELAQLQLPPVLRRSYPDRMRRTAHRTKPFAIIATEFGNVNRWENTRWTEQIRQILGGPKGRAVGNRW
jgi:hypothetical protein